MLHINFRASIIVWITLAIIVLLMILESTAQLLVPDRRSILADDLWRDRLSGRDAERPPAIPGHLCGPDEERGVGTMRFKVWQWRVVVCVWLFSCEAKAQGTFLGQNNVGAVIFYMSAWGIDQIKGINYSVQLHLFDPSKPAGLGLALGAQTNVGANGRFSVGVVEVPGVKPGETAPIVVRWWTEFNNSTWFASSYPIRTPPLGGDPDGNGPQLAIPPPPLLLRDTYPGPALIDASYSPWVYASDSIAGEYRLVSPAFNNAIGSSLRFLPGENDRFFRLVGATSAPILLHLGPAPSLGMEPPTPGLLRIIYHSPN